MHGAFSDQIRVLLHVFGDVIKEFVQANEVRPFYVPMRLLELCLQVHDVRQTLIDQRDDRLAVGLGRSFSVSWSFGFSVSGLIVAINLLSLISVPYGIGEYARAALFFAAKHFRHTPSEVERVARDGER